MEQDSTLTSFQIKGRPKDLWIYKSCKFPIDAARRFFQTKCDEFKLKERGIYECKVKKQRRRNRVVKVNIIFL